MAYSGQDRTRRIASEIRKQLAELLQHEADDPAFQGVTLTAARVSRDLSCATIYFTLMGEHEQDAGKEVMQKLQHAAGYLRRQIARGMKIRTVPQLRFFYDESIERASKIENLIDRALHGNDFSG
ncbi:MAG: 30S ribosome-binding factor RbfA [Gammaproteobacteria bacterium]|nr:MAG: 30S ribosome-binding factor RbfA [Gammaproteobacteria bacterium]